MPKVNSVIVKTPTNGPYALQFSVDGAVQDVLNTIQNAGVALDTVKAKVVALGGTVNRVTIIVDIIPSS